MALNDVIETLLSKLTVGYYDGKLRLLKKDEAGWRFHDAEEETRPHVLVLSRSCYSESCKKYPIAIRRELNQLLALEESDVSVINSTTEHESWVNQWRYETPIPDATLVIPESYALAGSAEINQVVSVDKEHQKTLFVVKTDKGVFSAPGGGVVNSSERFVESIGMHPDSMNNQDIIRVKEPDLPNQLIAGLANSQFNRFFPFISRQGSSVDKDTLKKAAITLSALMAVYIGLSTAYLWYENARAEAALTAQQQDLGDAFELLEQVESLSQQNSELASVSQEINVTSHVWTAVKMVFEQADVAFIKFENNRFTVSGEVARATDLLAKLSALPQVKDAKFEVPVSKRRRNERFVIGFQLVEDSLQELAQ